MKMHQTLFTKEKDGTKQVTMSVACPERSRFQKRP